MVFCFSSNHKCLWFMIMMHTCCRTFNTTIKLKWMGLGDWLCWWKDFIHISELHAYLCTDDLPLPKTNQASSSHYRYYALISIVLMMMGKHLISMPTNQSNWWTSLAFYKTIIFLSESMEKYNKKYRFGFVFIVECGILPNDDDLEKTN